MNKSKIGLLSQFLCASIYIALLATTTFASTPRLNTIMPRGVQRGATHKMTFHGQQLAGAQEILLYHSGITVDKIEPGENANQIIVTLTVAEDCRLGEHLLQVRTDDGISDFRNLYIGMLPHLQEAEPNNDLNTPQSIQSNVTVAGTIMQEDVDYYKISLKKGERLSVEVEAMRLGFWIDAYLAILDADFNELAACDDTPLLKNDPFITMLAPADGDYFIMLRESAYGGNVASRYRMHAGSFARPTAIFPAGGQPNQLAEISFLGDPSGPIAEAIQLPEKLQRREGLFLIQDEVSCPSPVPFRINELENLFESEPNDAYWPEQSIGSPPFALNGIIEKNGDSDIYRFTGKKNQVLDIECYAQRAGSGLDPIINLWTASDKKQVGGNDDARRPDCYMRYKLPADGDYFFRVKDHLDRGDPNFVYRVEFSQPEPQFSINIPRADRYSQIRQTIAVPQGSRFATMINASKKDIAGTVELISDNLPAGITMHAQPMRANLDSMPVVFEASADAQIAGQLVDFRGKMQTKDGRTILGSFVNKADFALGQPNNSLYYGSAVDRLAMAVIKPLPFKVDIIPPAAPLARDGQMDIRIVVTRDEGFDTAIALYFPFRPPGIGTKPKVVIPKGVSEITYPINANSKAQLGTWPIYVLANAKLPTGVATTSSQLAEIEVVEPYVSLAIKRATVPAGGATKLKCTLNQFTEFEGEATAEILGLPKQVVVPPMTFTSETTELEFDINPAADCPHGKHKGLFCRVTIPVGESKVVATAGRGELRVDKAPPVPAPGPAPAPEKPAPPKPKPAKPAPAKPTPAKNGEIQK